jgi:hypothetical protein
MIWTETAFYAYRTEKSRAVALSTAEADCAERLRKRPDQPCRVLHCERKAIIARRGYVETTGYAVQVSPRDRPKERV